MQSGPELGYDKPVKLTIRKNFKYDYLSAADYINSSDIGAVSVQHEFGLFARSRCRRLVLVFGF
jgi:hypothetical protein